MCEHAWAVSDIDPGKSNQIESTATIKSMCRLHIDWHYFQSCATASKKKWKSCCLHIASMVGHCRLRTVWLWALSAIQSTSRSHSKPSIPIRNGQFESDLSQFTNELFCVVATFTRYSTRHSIHLRLDINCTHENRSLVVYFLLCSSDGVFTFSIF